MTNPGPETFFNRTAELDALDRAWRRRGGGGQLCLLYGRRRLGKTYLLQHYMATGNGAGARPHCYYLSEQTTAANQRDQLARELLDNLPGTGVAVEDIAVSWNALLRHVVQASRERARKDGRFVLILDEFQYLIEQSPELPSALAAWWDREGTHSPLLVVLCGSQLGAMAALGSESQPLFGRFNAGIFRLGPLGYEDVAAFYADSPQYGPIEKLLMYGVLGGTPRYHALVDTGQPPDREIRTLLLQPRAILENEVRFLLGSEQIRDPAPYNAVLGAIAAGQTQFGNIANIVGTPASKTTFYLRTLQELGWIRRELPFGEHSDRRALYRVDDPFLAFWYRFVAPLASALAFGDTETIYNTRVAPHLADYMGRMVFEGICAQWLARRGQARLGLSLRAAGRYWSRDGATEIDIVSQLDDGAYLFGECKWRPQGKLGLSTLNSLQAKVAGLPEASWKKSPTWVLFCAGAFTPELRALAKEPGQRIFLVGTEDLLS